MTAMEKTILDRFKALLSKRMKLYKLILFGSRARGDAEPASDMNVLVVLAERYETEQSPLLINVRREGVAV